MQPPTDTELAPMAREAGYTPPAFAMLLQEEFAIRVGDYIGYKNRLAIQEWLTEEGARHWNRRAGGEAPPDMPGVDVFENQ